MRRFLAPLALALALPLSACFDADVTVDMTNVDEVKLDAIMSMDAEAYQMASGMGGDPCEDGVGEIKDDGSFTCSMLERRSLDELIAAMDDPSNDIGIGDGIDIERREGGLVFVSFDVSEMTADMPSAEDRAQMAAMFGDAFQGHNFTLQVIGKEIIETSGERVDDTTAELSIPLGELFSATPPDLPDFFTVLLEPGS